MVGGLLLTLRWQLKDEQFQAELARGSKSCNKVSAWEPEEGSVLGQLGSWSRYSNMIKPYNEKALTNPTVQKARSHLIVHVIELSRYQLRDGTLVSVC